MTTLPILPAFAENNVVITLQSSDFFAPYASVTVQSIVDNATEENNYDIIVTTLSMTEETAKKFCSIADGRDNISVRVVNAAEIFKKYIDVNDKTYSGETITRIMLTELLENYDKTLNIDCDMLFCADAAELYNQNIENMYLGAMRDLYCYLLYHSANENTYFQKKMVDYVLNMPKFLELPSIESEINGGLLLLNLKEIRKDFTIQQIADYINDKNPILFEQDTFSHFFCRRTVYLDLAWNYTTSYDSIFGKHNFYNLKTDDNYIVAFKNASKNIKNLHYVTRIKPWQNPNVPFGTKWWNVAFKSPFYEQIVHRRFETDKKTQPTRLLFMCETVMQLINILNIKFNLYPKTKADIIFTESTDFSRYIEPIEKLGMFERIYKSSYNAATEWENLSKTAPNTHIMKNPSEYKHTVPLTEKYSDLFISTTNPISKIVYYQIVKLGCRPLIHFYEEGATTYVNNIHTNVSYDMFDHNVYKENDHFENNICEVLLYEPQLYCAGEKRMLSVLPKICKNNKSFIDILYNVFGKVELPKEKYIFFSECFAVDMCVSNDIEILDRIAERVGKENITVKAHPRGKTEEKFYEMHGYKIFVEKTIPWEIFVLSAEIENKILISVSSNTLLNQSIIFDKDVPAVFLLNSMILSKRPVMRNSAYKNFFANALALMNLKKRIAFCPNSITELDAIIDYLEGEL